MKALVVFHKSDLDGVCSAAIVKHFVPDCELHGMDYGDEFPWDLVDQGVSVAPMYSKWEDAWSRTVYMVDFSLPPEDMERLASVSELVWIDHHKTAIDACGKVTIDHLLHTDFAACELTWAWFNAEVTQGEHWETKKFDFLDVPSAVRLLGRYDVWGDAEPDWKSRILPFQYGCRALPGIYDPENDRWEDLLSYDWSDDYVEMPWLHHVVDTGDSILRFQATQNQRACEAGAFEHNWYVIDPLLADVDARYAEFKKRALRPCSEDAADNLMAENLNKDRSWVFFEPGGWDLEDGAGGFGHVWDSHEDDCGEGAVSVEVSSCRTVTRHRALCCNTGIHNSSFFDGFYNPEKHDIMAAFVQLANGKWKVSMYTDKEDINVGDIAKTFGGGGHAGAAGFVCEQLPWEK